MTLKTLTLAALGVLGTSTIAVSAQAANTVLLQGSVPTVCSVDVHPNGANLTLPIQAGGSVNIGQIEENCNYTGGYTIKASSPTAGNLVNTINPSLQTSYSLSVEGGLSNVTPGVAPTPVRSVGALSSPAVGVMKNVVVNVTPYATALAGTYEDTLTVTITTP